MAREEFSRNIAAPCSRSEAWKVLTDVQKLASWISIVNSLKEHAPLDSYTAVLEDRLGPFRLRADLDIDVIGIVEDEEITARASGEDRQVSSRIAVQCRLALEDAGSGGTNVQLYGTYEVVGRVASLGESSIKRKANIVLEEFFTNLSDALASAGDTKGAV